MVKCQNEKCSNDLVKIKFAGKRMFAKFTFIVQEDKRRIELTMFHNVVNSIVPDAWDMDKDVLTESILAIDEILITKDARNVVTVTVLTVHYF